MVDGGEPGVDSRDEGKHTGRNDLLFTVLLNRDCLSRTATLDCLEP